jgi:hypothetical protein
VSTLDRFLESIPDPQRESVRSALSAAFGATPPSDAQLVTGGASGALTYRLEVGGRPYFLRVETRRDATRNPHQYTCLRTAADAGIAPPVRHLDETAGTVVMDFIPQRPLAEYPGGSAALAGALGDLVRGLQGTSVFPELRDYPAILRFMLSHLRSSGRFAPGLLDPHASEFERIAGVYPWQLQPRVSSHNDPNPRNILFDGYRLWLVDWETSFRNDPMVDVAILADNLASSPELEAILLGTWLGREPDRHVRGRLTLMKPLTRLYYGLILFALSPAPPEEHSDLSALTPREFGAALARGTLTPGSPEAMLALGKMLLAGFLDATRAADFEVALTVVAEG